MTEISGRDFPDFGKHSPYFAPVKNFQVAANNKPCQTAHDDQMSTNP